MWRCWSFFLLAIIIAYPEAVHAVNRNKRAREDGCLETVGASQRAVGSVQVDPATRLVTTRKSRLKSVQLLPPRVPTRRRSLVRNNTEGLVPRIASTDTGIRILSNYKRVADIGSGSFGRVHVASDLRNHGRLVAIKRQDTSTASRRMVAFNEFHLLQRLRGCACIVQIFKGLTTKCRLYLVMEYLSGGTLAHRIRSQDGISERDAKRYLHDIVCGVDACHSRDIILNDIKPDNMAFDGEGNLKLIDFGVAEYSPHRKMSKSMTTANYVSPEQFELVDQRVQMKEFDGAAADVWAVGATLIEMLTGHCLFLGRGDEDVIRNVLNLHINVRCLAGYRHLSQGARLLVERMLEQDPKMRPTIREIALDEWLQPESNANA
ncbi:non-specific serine/threonine protein kinase [Plasmodiophora brassicae]